MVLYIDHYDSFSSTIVDYITYLGYQVSMLKTDEQIDNIDQYSHIIIGPGPGHPDELKNIYPIIEYCQQKKITFVRNMFRSSAYCSILWCKNHKS